MSAHNTMGSNVSEIISQQRSHLQHLQNLQQRARSMTSMDYSTYYALQQQRQQQSQSQQQQQSQHLPTMNSGSTNQSTIFSSQNAQGANTLSSNPIGVATIAGASPSVNTPTVPPSASNINLNQPSQTQQNNQLTFTSQAPQTPSQLQPATATTHHNKSAKLNSMTNASTVSRAQSSIARQRINQHQDPRSPLVILMPTSAQPTEVLAARFSAWRNVIKSILTYLTETASIQDEIVRQQLRLSNAIQFPFFQMENQPQPTSLEDKNIQKFFLPLGNGSIQDLPTILNHYHSILASLASKSSKELTNDVIPRLEDLRRDLLVKIKEIKALQSDFKNTCNKELAQTKQDMKQFIESLKETRYNSTPSKDPYITKIILDKQIRKQLIEENFLHEAFDNLESSAAELEKVVVMEIQNALTIYARLLGQESQLVFDILISKLDVGFFSKDPQFEWDNFIQRNDNFIPPNLPMRKMKEIVYKFQHDPMTYEIKGGYLERRSKYLKSYSKGFYVLTPTFLHEFKTPSREKDLVPVMSLALVDCSVSEHSKKESGEYKFILHHKKNGIIRKGANWVFKADNYETMISWYKDIKRFTSFSSASEKSKYITEKLRLDKDGKPRTPKKSKNRDTSSIAAESGVTAPDLTSFSTTIPMSTPKLDNNTNTNTTSSIPDTNDPQLQNTLPNFYVETINPDYKD